MNHNTQRYKSRLKKKLHCTRKTQYKLLSEFDCMLNGFLDENPDASFDDLCSAFGPPEEMANVLMGKLDDREKRAYKTRRLVLCIVAGVLAAIIMSLTIYVFFWKEKPINAIDSGEIVDSFEVSNDFEVVDSLDVNKGE